MDFTGPVLKGIEFLDEIKPEWRERIDWGMLIMTSADWCIAGQLFGNQGRSGFQAVLDHIQPDLERWDYGFDVPPGCLDVIDSYSDLHRAWIDLA